MRSITTAGPGPRNKLVTSADTPLSLLGRGEEKRFSRNMLIGSSVRPWSAKSARISPTTEANLKPWPEKPVAKQTRSCSG